MTSLFLVVLWIRLSHCIRVTEERHGYLGFCLLSTAPCGRCCLGRLVSGDFQIELVVKSFSVNVSVSGS